MHRAYNGVAPHALDWSSEDIRSRGFAVKNLTGVQKALKAKAEALGQTWMKGVSGEHAWQILKAQIEQRSCAASFIIRQPQDQ